MLKMHDVNYLPLLTSLFWDYSVSPWVQSRLAFVLKVGSSVRARQFRAAPLPLTDCRDWRCSVNISTKQMLHPMQKDLNRQHISDGSTYYYGITHELDISIRAINFFSRNGWRSIHANARTKGSFYWRMNSEVPG